MSHLTFLTLGSRGDIVPYMALGRHLRARGHAVRFISSQDFSSLAADHGLDFHPLHVDLQALVGGESGQQLLGSGQNLFRQAAAIRAAFGRLSDTIAHDLLAPALRATDAILCQTPGALYGADLAEAARAPLIQLAVMPLERTRRWPHLAVASSLGRLPGVTRLSYPLAEQLVWQIFRPAINRFRRRLGLQPRGPGGYFRQLRARGVPVINGFSPLVVPPPSDWPVHVHQTGYWHPHDPAWQPPPALLRFLEDGPPPVFVGFGSMPLRDPARTTAALLEALRLSGQRGLLHGGWGGLAAAQLPPNVFPVPYADFGWLFARAAAVVHHGGSGTTATGLRAGVPGLLVPFAFDQFFWGDRVHALGVGPRPIPFARLTAQRLAAALTETLNDTALRSRARALGQALSAEDGPGHAASLIERYIQTGQPPI